MNKLSFENAKRGDASALRELVQTLYPRIVRMAAYYGRRSGEDHEDLAQEAWMGLLEALPVLDTSIGSPEQYLLQRARWRLLDALKRAFSRRLSPLPDEYDSVPDTRSELPEDALSAREFFECLGPRERGIAERLFAGLTWRETGEALGCTSANIGYYVRRIKSQTEDWAADFAAVA